MFACMYIVVLSYGIPYGMVQISPDKSLPKKNYPEISPDNSFFSMFVYQRIIQFIQDSSGGFSFFSMLVYGENHPIHPNPPEDSLDNSLTSTTYQSVIAVLSSNLTKTSKQELLAKASNTMYLFQGQYLQRLRTLKPLILRVMDSSNRFLRRILQAQRILRRNRIILFFGYITV